MVPKLNIAAVQFKWSIDDYKNRITFQKRINTVLENIRAKVDPAFPLLVVFPEDIGTPLILFNSLISKKKNFLKLCGH